jgi:hypothetical protein
MRKHSKKVGVNLQKKSGFELGDVCKMTLEQIAEITHEANRLLCLSHGDVSQPVWADAPDWQVRSAAAGVEFLKDHPDASPGDSHESWRRQKLEEGWSWGETKDPEAKTHPCLVIYDALPDFQKAKDRLFVSIVRALLPEVPVS